MGQTKPDLPRSQEWVHFANAMLDWAATLPGLTRRLLTISIMQGLARRLYGGEAQGPCSPARERGARNVHDAPRLRRSTPCRRSRPIDRTVCRRGLSRAFEYIADADLLGVDALSFVREGRVARDNETVFDAREFGGEVFGVRVERSFR